MMLHTKIHTCAQDFS